MPVRKFRSVEEMERPHWREPGDPSLYRTMARVWAFGQRTAGYRFPPGVYRHRSVQELNAQTAMWSVARVRTRLAREGDPRARSGPADRDRR